MPNQPRESVSRMRLPGVIGTTEDFRVGSDDVLQHANRVRLSVGVGPNGRPKAQVGTTLTQSQ